MKQVISLGIILIFAFLGEILKNLLPLPIPASIYGMILLFLALIFKIIKVEYIEKVSNFLISIMLLFFIMPAVSMMDSFDLIKDNLIQIIIAVIVPTIVVIIVTGLVTQWIEKLTEKSKKKERSKNNGDVS